MKTKLLYLLALLFVFTGCSEKEEPEKTYLLQHKSSVVTYPSGGGLTIDLSYTYNDKDQLVGISGVTVRDGETITGTTTINYDSQGRVAFVQNSLGTTWTNTYNDKGQLEKVVKKFASSEPTVSEHFYDNADRLTQVVIYQQKDNALYGIGTFAYTYTGSNGIKIKKMNSSGTVNQEHTIITDAHNRELPYLPHQITMEFFAAEVFAEPLLTRHNIISNELMNVIQGNKLGVSYTAAYTYNEGGYPVSAVKTFQEGSVEKVAYKYTSK